jgi:hypothetical protein
MGGLDGSVGGRAKRRAADRDDAQTGTQGIENLMHLLSARSHRPLIKVAACLEV